jgi:ParB family chromosome partitioning protein
MTNPSPPPNPRKKTALGRGLAALIPDIESDAGGGASHDFFECDTDLIRPNRYQPRLRFEETELGELADSIRSQGVIQPLLVRRDGTGFELVTGERRLRAARLAGLTRVPVVLKEFSDRQMLEISIVENIQREDFNPMEEAEAYHRLISEFQLTQEQAAGRVGKSRSAVANILRLRQLPQPIKDRILDGSLSMGHARALLSADTSAQQQAACQAVIARRLSVRETEALVRRLKASKSAARRTAADTEAHYIQGLADELSQRFGTRVQIRRQGKKGRVEIEFYSDEDLDRLLQLLGH